MSGEAPTTRSRTVSSPHPPTLHPGRRVRSLGAALAGGSPQSSPSPSGSERLSPLGGSFPEIVHSLTLPPPQQASTSRGAPTSPPVASTSGIRATSEPNPFLASADRVLSPPLSPIGDVDMESATNRDLTRALAELTARLPVPLSGVERAVDEAKVKINAATSDYGVVVVLPHQFQSDVREYLKGYHAEVESLARARSSLSKHRSSKTYPPSLGSIKSPSIQFSHAFVNAPADEGHRGTYSFTPGAGLTTFEQSMESAVKTLKDAVLKGFISEKEKEVTFLERKASAAQAIVALESVVTTKHTQLKARYDYLEATPDAHARMLRDVDQHAAMSHALAAAIISKVTGLVLDAEEDRLVIAMKKIALEKPAVGAGSQAPPNDLLELKKMMVVLSKKVELQSKKVRDGLLRLLCVCAGHLSLTHPLLESLF